MVWPTSWDHHRHHSRAGECQRQLQSCVMCRPLEPRLLRLLHCSQNKVKTALSSVAAARGLLHPQQPNSKAWRQTHAASTIAWPRRGNKLTWDFSLEQLVPNLVQCAPSLRSSLLRTRGPGFKARNSFFLFKGFKATVLKFGKESIVSSSNFVENKMPEGWQAQPGPPPPPYGQAQPGPPPPPYEVAVNQGSRPAGVLVLT